MFIKILLMRRTREHDMLLNTVGDPKNDYLPVKSFKKVNYSTVT
jgi:hypothetical protein